jgi:hypothetical protein
LRRRRAKWRSNHVIVDGKEVARKSMEHTAPITFPEDETFDIGQDTRSPLAPVPAVMRRRRTRERWRQEAR